MAAADLNAVSRAVVRCTKCPELRTYCRQVAVEKKRAYRDWTYWGKPVPAFGDPHARVMLVGLAPGAHGSNRTGRMFTGDASGDFLYPALHRAGFATQASALSADDGLELRDCIITAALRCAPQQNKPTPVQLKHCLPHLIAEMNALQTVRVIVGLGSIGFYAAAKALRIVGFVFQGHFSPRFGHSLEYRANKGPQSITLLGCYHPSRQNTNTGVLSASMLNTVLARAKHLADN